MYIDIVKYGIYYLPYHQTPVALHLLPCCPALRVLVALVTESDGMKVMPACIGQGYRLWDSAVHSRTAKFASAAVRVLDS
eukprot:scaffold414223_cov21-Prasinocladus_malaysianus.AAC.1